MGLFSRKKPAPAPAPVAMPQKKPETKVNPDDIWNTPRKSAVKGSKYGDESTEAMTEPVSIDPETIKKKMEALEQELEEQKNKPVTPYEPIASVEDEEVTVAQAKYEEQYRIEHEKYIQSHQQDIAGAANTDDLEERISVMVSEHVRHEEESKAQQGNIEGADPEQIASGMSELGVAKDVTLDKDYKNIKEVTADEVAEKLSGLGVAKDVTLDKEYKNIQGISAEDTEAKTKEFLEKYGDRK